MYTKKGYVFVSPNFMLGIFGMENTVILLVDPQSGYKHF